MFPHISGDAISVEGLLARIANYKTLLPIAILVVSVGLASPALAYQGGDYSQQVYTHQTNPGLVCGNHLCGPGEMPQNPPTVKPVGGSLG